MEDTEEYLDEEIRLDVNKSIIETIVFQFHILFMEIVFKLKCLENRLRQKLCVAIIIG